MLKVGPDVPVLGTLGQDAGRINSHQAKINALRTVHRYCITIQIVGVSVIEPVSRFVMRTVLYWKSNRIQVLSLKLDTMFHPNQVDKGFPQSIASLLSGSRSPAR